MGRDTSISSVDAEAYFKLQEAKQEVNRLEALDWCDDFDLWTAYEEEDKAEKALDMETIRYWGKSDCSAAVSLFRRYKKEDGDIIIDGEILNALLEELVDEFTVAQVDRLRHAINDKYQLLVYNTN